MQEQINLLQNELNGLKQKKQQVITMKTTKYDLQISEYQKAIDALKELS